MIAKDKSFLVLEHDSLVKVQKRAQTILYYFNHESVVNHSESKLEKLLMKNVQSTFQRMDFWGEIVRSPK